MKLSFLPLFLIPLQASLNAQVVIRSVATSGMEVPGHPGVTMDGFGKVSMDPFGQVIFTAGRRQNNITIGNVAVSWLPGAPLEYLSSQVPRKYEEIPLTTGIRLAEWGHEREEKALDFALGRVGGEAVDLPLRVTGGGSAVCLRGR
jgi:hypothetical protein